MKYIMLAFTVFLLSSTMGYSQITVYLKNGEIKEGNIGKFSTAYGSAVKRFKLKTGENGKFQKYKAKQVDSIIYHKNGEKIVYHGLLGVWGKPDFYLLFERGKINIYKVEAMTTTGYGAFSSTYFPVKRPEEERIANLDKGGPYWSNFAKVASEYFSDCPEIVEKIQAREEGFSKDDQTQIVQYYNQHCN